MASAILIPKFTAAQYLALERKADFKSEYYNGYIVAMAGASREHSLIVSNVSRQIGNQLEDRPCEVHITDMRVRVSPTGLYTYPDVLAVCGEAEFEDDELDTLLNPTMIVEVLSPTTESYDRGDKFMQYRELAVPARVRAHCAGQSPRRALYATGRQLGLHGFPESR